MDHATRSARAVAEIERLAEVVSGLELTTPVPACPGWDLGKLIRHTGRVHRWATHVIVTGAAQRPDPRAVPDDLPEDPGELPAWLRAGGSALGAALGSVGADDPLYSLCPPNTGGFWSRRMLMETTVHRADVELATGRTPAIDAEVAVDGVDECLDLLGAGAGAERDLGEPGRSIHLHATDVDGEWLIQLGEQGFTWTRGHAKAAVAVRATAVDLLLFGWGRRAAADDRLAIFGDEDVLARWTAGAAL